MTHNFTFEEFVNWYWERASIYVYVTRQENRRLIRHQHREDAYELPWLRNIWESWNRTCEKLMVEGKGLLQEVFVSLVPWKCFYFSVHKSGTVVDVS